MTAVVEAESLTKRFGEIPAVHAESAARASLACLSPSRTSGSDGVWFLLVQDDDGRPIDTAVVGLVFDSANPPIAQASEALTRASYEHKHAIVAMPWGAEWQIIRPDDRRPA
ncbi:MAG: hypothetical protein ACRDZR_06780 [Acidimicrobiales bacterium]